MSRENKSQRTTCLVMGDLHFKTNNAEQSNEFTSKCLELTKNLKPDFIVCLGDILDTHERYDEGPFNRAVSFIDNLSQISPVFVLIGNHDLINNTQFLSDRHAFNALKKWSNVYVIDDITEYKVRNTEQSFVFCPYVPPGRFMEALNGSGIMWENANAIFCHQEMKGVKMGAVVSVQGDEWESGMPLLVCGHIHDEQVLKDEVSTSLEECPYPDVIYTGSAMQHSFGEMTRKHIYLFKFGDEYENGYSYERHNLGLKLKKTFYLDVGKVKDFDLKMCEQYYVKIALNGKREDCQVFRNSDLYREMEGMGIKFKFNVVKEEAKRLQSELKKRYGTDKTRLFNYSDILRDLVLKENDTDLNQDYEEITNEKLEDATNSSKNSTQSSKKSSVQSSKKSSPEPPTTSLPVVNKPSVDLKVILNKKPSEKLFAVKGKYDLEFEIVSPKKKLTQKNKK